MKKFKEGDVVREKTGGPKMTIEEVKGESASNLYYNCIWFDNDEFFRSSISHDSLEK